MSTDRDIILARINEALRDLPEKSPYPEYSDSLPVSRNINLSGSLKEQFIERLEKAGGLFFDCFAKLGTYLESNNYSFGYCDPQLAESLQGIDGITFDTEYDMLKVDDYQFGITKGSAGIAESGTIVLKDSETSARLGALAPWVHIAVIRESDIVPCPLQAIEQFGNDPSVIFCTGPSKTADVEGILIKGVHGPGVQIALIIS